MERLLTDEEIRRAMRLPPTDTRAYFRGTCLRKFPKQVYGASWTSILLDTGDAAVKRIPMAEPARGTAETGGGDLGAVGERGGSLGAAGRLNDTAMGHVGDWGIWRFGDRAIRQLGRCDGHP